MWDAITKLRAPVILILLGVAFLMPSMLTGLSVANFDPQPRGSIAIVPMIAGLGFLVAGLFLILDESGLLPSPGRAVRRVGSTYVACLGPVQVSVHFGTLEETVLYKPNARQIVLLPTNEFFDEDCFDSTSTACGAYLAAKAGPEVRSIKGQVEELKSTMAIAGRFEKQSGLVVDSYGAGNCLFLKSAPPLPHAVLLASVATKRAGSGFQSNPGYVFQCIEGMAVHATNYGASDVYMPLLGAGKGGLNAEAALMIILLSISSAQQRIGGFDAKVHIIVFQKTAASKPAMSRRAAAKVLALAHGIQSRQRIAV